MDPNNALAVGATLDEVYAAGSDDEVVDTVEDEDDDDDDDDAMAEDEDDTATGTKARLWREGTCQPNIPDFKGKPGPTIELPDDATPFDYLKEFITPDMMQRIVDETNRYASTFLESATLPPRSRFQKWTETTVEEMWGFFGIITSMGLIQISELDEYWSTDALYSLPFFASTMKRDRFQVLLTFLHLNDNATQVPREENGYDPLHKLAPFLKSLEEKFQGNYYPKKNLALDEAMVQWRGQQSNVHFRVYVPNKPEKYGIKLYEICDSDNGYCCRFEVYTGKKTSSPDEARHDLVLRMIEPYLDMGHHLYLDEYFTSPKLFEHLAARATPACGTLQPNQSGLAPQMQAKRVVKRKGEEKSMTNGWLNHIKFHDRKEVNMLTTLHTNQKVDTGRTDRYTGEHIIRHKVAVDYNKYMGAVDRSDQMMLQNGSFKRKMMKWWKKLFFHLLMLAELNTYLVYKAVMTGKGKRPMEHRIFRRELAKEMASLMPTSRDIINRRAAEVGDSSIHRLTARHFASKVKSKRNPQKVPKQSLCRICVICSSLDPKKKTANNNKKRKKTTFECAACDVGLCATPCFELYHTQKDYKRARRRQREATSTGETAA